MMQRKGMVTGLYRKHRPHLAGPGFSPATFKLFPLWRNLGNFNNNLLNTFILFIHTWHEM